MSHPGNHLSQSLFRLLTGTVNVAGVHIHAKGIQLNFSHSPLGGGGAVNGTVDMSLAAQHDTVLSSQLCTLRQSIDAVDHILLHITLAAGANVDHRNAQVLCSLERLGQAILIQGSNLHGKQLHAGFFGSGLDQGCFGFPCIQNQMLAHALDGGKLYTIISGQLNGLHGSLYVDTFK